MHKEISIISPMAWRHFAERVLLQYVLPEESVKKPQ